MDLMPGINSKLPPDEDYFKTISYLSNASNNLTNNNGHGSDDITHQRMQVHKITTINNKLSSAIFICTT